MQDPIEDAERLQATLSRADSIVVVERHTYDHRRRKNNKVLARSRDTTLVSEAVGAIDPDFAAERRYWMTPGRPTFAFLRDRELLATVTCLNPDWVRSDTLWTGDAPLQNGGALLDVLVVLAAQTIEERLHAGEAPDSVARAVKSSFDLSPASRVALAMLGGGLQLAEAHAAARSTMTDQELAAHTQLNDSFSDVMEPAGDDGPTACREQEQ